jgi:hypothetical protein
MLTGSAVLAALLVILINLLVAVRAFGRLEGKVDEIGRQAERVEKRINSLPCQEEEPCPARRLVTPAT